MAWPPQLKEDLRCCGAAMPCRTMSLTGLCQGGSVVLWQLQELWIAFCSHPHLSCAHP